MSEDRGRGGPGRSDEEHRDAGRPTLRPSQVRAAAGEPAGSSGTGGPSGPTTSSDPASWRVTFAYEGAKVRVVARRRVAALAPPDDAALVAAGSRGSWVEVRDAAGAVLYTQVLHRPVRPEYEVHNRHGVLPRHVAPDEVKGAFEVVVPDLPGGVELVVRGRADADPADAARRAPRQLAKVRLEEGTD